MSQDPTIDFCARKPYDALASFQFVRVCWGSRGPRSLLELYYCSSTKYLDATDANESWCSGCTFDTVQSFMPRQRLFIQC